MRGRAIRPHRTGRTPTVEPSRSRRDDVYRVLSIDGGGIRGILPARILAWLEERTGRPTSELFDLIAGTSTGAILTAGLTVPDTAGSPRLDAATMERLYHEQGPRIFSRPVLHRVRTANGTLGPRYPSTALAEVLADTLGDARLADLRTDVLIPAYESELRTPWFFRSTRAQRDPACDFALTDVVQAATAAPTYFRPARITGGDGRSWTLLDGGLYANDPALSALVEAFAVPDITEVVVLSLGTGALNRPLPYETIRSWGLIRWARPVLEVVFDGVSDVVDHLMSRLVRSTDRLTRYERIQVDLSASDAIDDASPANLAALSALADQMVDEHRPLLEDLAALLTS